MSALQFVFVVGWMKVAESMINPLGEDDDDFECNFLLDRNLSVVGLSIVDEACNKPPELAKDIFWSSYDVEPLYSLDTALIPKNPQIGSAAAYELKEEDVLMMPHVNAVEDADLNFGSRVIPRKTFSVVGNPFGSRLSLSTTRKRSAFAFDAITRKISSHSSSRMHLNKAYSQASLDCATILEDQSQNLPVGKWEEARHKSSFALPTHTYSEQATSTQKLSMDALTTVVEEDEDRAKSSTDKSSPL